MPTKFLQALIPQWCSRWRKEKSDSETTQGSGSTLKLISSRRSALTHAVMPAKFGRRPFRIRQLSYLQNDRQNDHITSASSTEVTNIITNVGNQAQTPRDDTWELATYLLVMTCFALLNRISQTSRLFLVSGLRRPFQKFHRHPSITLWVILLIAIEAIAWRPWRR